MFKNSKKTMGKPSPHSWAYMVAAFLSHEGVAKASELEEQATPLELELAYTADVWNLASGDGADDLRYLDNFDIVLNADMEELAGLNDTTVSFYGLYNNGNFFSEDVVGDALVISNIEAPVQAFRLYEAWVEHRFGGGPVSARFGLYDLNSEFDALETSSLFIGSAHGIGADISQSGETGPSIFPITSLALRLEYEASDALTFRAAVLDGVAGAPDNLQKTAVNLSESDGALVITEADYQAGPFRAIGGVWHYTSSVDRHDSAGKGDSQGAYIRGESILLEGENGLGELSGFFRAGWANGAVNDFSAFYSAGLVYDGILHPDGEDQFGFAVAYAGVSDKYLAANPESADNETVVELTYRTPTTEWFSLQPNIQYVINPGLDPVARNALAVGLRVEFGLSHGVGRD